MKLFPALDIPESDELVLAALDDFAPTAVEEREPGARVFFATSGQRDAARAELAARQLNAVSVEVPDEDWAARSQQHLQPVTVGRVRIVSSAAATPESLLPNPQSLIPRLRSCVTQTSFGEARQSGRAATAANPLSIVIEPSMGFGTGHHASTRLCLAAMQQARVSGSFVLDVGTGSGILAIAAARLGAGRALGIDVDADAVESAERNLALNPEASHVTVAVADLASDALSPADIVLANLTGATLVRSADTLLGAVRSGGTLIVSGLLTTDEDEVRRAYRPAEIVERTQEDEWVCLRMKKG